jgi:hypothetical protein
MAFRTVSLDELTIDDEPSLRSVALYGRLKQALRRSGYRFSIPAAGTKASWDRVLFLNLTYWGGPRAGDVLPDDHIPADVVAHVAWHHLANRRLGPRQDAPARPATAAVLMLAESIASAFDLYLVGRLLVTAPECDFITTQVPMMAACAEAAGLPAATFATLMEDVSREPERAFEEMRALLLDVVTALLSCTDADQAEEALNGFAARRFEPLLHHFELSNWILYARAHAAPPSPGDAVVAALDAALRAAPIALDWLADHWLAPDEAATR